MDRIINVKVGGSHLTKDNKNAGVRGEANVTYLRITFDEGWDGYTKMVTFWDARGLNPVFRTLTTDIQENTAESTRVYLVPIPAEPMAEAGMLTFVIDGYLDGKKQRSLSDTLVVKDAPIADNAGEPVDPSPTPSEQFQSELEHIMGTIQDAAKAQATANTALEYLGKAKECVAEAQRSVGKTSYIGDNGNWFAWDNDKNEFYDTGVKAQAGSTVYVGDNPPDDAAVWVYPEGDASGGNSGFSGEETDPTVYPWAKQPTKPTYTADEVGAYDKEHIDSEFRDVDDSISKLTMSYGMMREAVVGLSKQITEESHFRGYLSTNAKIQALQATPNDFAYSAESGTKWVYDAKEGWKDTNAPVPDQLTPASDSTPLMNGEASKGTEEAYARGDHRHPHDSTKVDKTEFNELKADINSALDELHNYAQALIGGAS